MGYLLKDPRLESALTRLRNAWPNMLLLFVFHRKRFASKNKLSRLSLVVVSLVVVQNENACELAEWVLMNIKNRLSTKPEAVIKTRWPSCSNPTEMAWNAWSNCVAGVSAIFSDVRLRLRDTISIARLRRVDDAIPARVVIIRSTFPCFATRAWAWYNFRHCSLRFERCCKTLPFSCQSHS